MFVGDIVRQKDIRFRGELDSKGSIVEQLNKQRVKLCQVWMLFIEYSFFEKYGSQ